MPLPYRFDLPRSSRFLLLAALTALPASGCKEDEGPLVDVQGQSWTLTAYDIDGDGNYSYKEAACTTAVRLAFVSDNVATLARNVSLAGIDDTVCSSDETEFTCRCFAYSYEDDTQVWQEFSPGGTPPTDLSGGSTVLLSEEGNVSGRYIFAPLPEGVLGSDGDTSAYMFDKKALSLAEETGCPAACAPVSE